MRDIHGFETRENCFGTAEFSEYAGDYDPDYVDDPTAEEMAFGEEALSVATTEPSPANIAWRKRLEAR